MPDNLISDTEDVEKRKKEERRLARELSDLRIVIKTVEGRRTLWGVLEQSGLFKASYVHGDQGYGTTKNVGRMEIGQWLLFKLMEAKPEAFVQMQNEHASELQREENEFKEEVKDKTVLKNT